MCYFYNNLVSYDACQLPAQQPAEHACGINVEHILSRAAACILYVCVYYTEINSIFVNNKSDRYKTLKIICNWLWVKELIQNLFSIQNKYPNLRVEKVWKFEFSTNVLWKIPSSMIKFCVTDSMFIKVMYWSKSSTGFIIYWTI